MSSSINKIIQIGRTREQKNKKKQDLAKRIRKSTHTHTHDPMWGNLKSHTFSRFHQIITTIITMSVDDETDKQQYFFLKN